MTLPELLAKHSLPAEVIDHLLEQDREIARLRAAPALPLWPLRVESAPHCEGRTTTVVRYQNALCYGAHQDPVS